MSFLWASTQARKLANKTGPWSQASQEARATSCQGPHFENISKDSNDFQYLFKCQHRSVSQEKQPLLPAGVSLDGSLESQVEAISESLASAFKGDDLVVAQAKALAPVCADMFMRLCDRCQIQIGQHFWSNIIQLYAFWEIDSDW